MTASAALRDERSAGRDEVHYRARAFGPDARQISITIVNISAMGLMARSDVPFATGDRLRIVLPVIGPVAAEVRWSLGGRIGCELDQAIGLSDYYELLAALVKGR